MLDALRRREVALSALFAVLVHVTFLASLVIGVSWKKVTPPKLVVELWRELPPVRHTSPQPPAAKVPPAPKAVPKPAPKPAEPPPKPAPKPPEPRPEPPPKPVAEKPAPEPPKPAGPPSAASPRPTPRKGAVEIRDTSAGKASGLAAAEREFRDERRQIAQAMQDEARRLAEERKRVDADRRAEEAARRRAEEAAQAEDLRVLREALQKQQRVADEQRAARETSEAEQRAALAAAAKALRTIDEYTARIQAAIREWVRLPPGMAGNPEAIFEVKLLRGGTVASVKLAKSSGVTAYDKAVENAIFKAEPLPVPDDPELLLQMRDLRLVFRPND
jgi:colicin import membrane protein